MLIDCVNCELFRDDFEANETFKTAAVLHLILLET